MKVSSEVMGFLVTVGQTKITFILNLLIIYFLIVNLPSRYETQYHCRNCPFSNLKKGLFYCYQVNIKCLGQFNF